MFCVADARDGDTACFGFRASCFIRTAMDVPSPVVIISHGLEPRPRLPRPHHHGATFNPRLLLTFYVTSFVSWVSFYCRYHKYQASRSRSSLIYFLGYPHTFASSTSASATELAHLPVLCGISGGHLVDNSSQGGSSHFPALCVLSICGVSSSILLGEVICFSFIGAFCFCLSTGGLLGVVTSAVPVRWTS